MIAGYYKHKQKKFQLYCDLVDQAFLQFNENLTKKRVPYSQIENVETPGAEYPDDDFKNKQQKCMK